MLALPEGGSGGSLQTFPRSLNLVGDTDRGQLVSPKPLPGTQKLANDSRLQSPKPPFSMTSQAFSFAVMACHGHLLGDMTLARCALRTDQQMTASLVDMLLYRGIRLSICPQIPTFPPLWHSPTMACSLAWAVTPLPEE